MNRVFSLVILGGLIGAEIFGLAQWIGLPDATSNDDAPAAVQTGPADAHR